MDAALFRKVSPPSVFKHLLFFQISALHVIESPIQIVHLSAAQESNKWVQITRKVLHSWFFILRLHHSILMFQDHFKISRRSRFAWNPLETEHSAATDEEISMQQTGLQAYSWFGNRQYQMHFFYLLGTWSKLFYWLNLA